MLITAPARNLAKAASMAAEMSKSKSNIPILGSLLVTADSTTVSFAGSNLEGYLNATVAAGVEGSGSAALDGRIAQLLKSLPGDATARLTVDQCIATLQCGRAKYRIGVLPAEEFPPAPTAEDAEELQFSDEDRRRLFEMPSHAISDEETRYYLCGLNLKCDGGLIACATDGHQLITTNISSQLVDLPGGAGGQGVIIPAPACSVISKLDGCTLQINDKAIEAFTDTVHFSHKLIDASFPNFERLLPEPSGNSIKLDRKELIAALHRMALAATSERAVVAAARLEWGDELSLSLARQPDAAADVLPAEANGTGRFSADISKLTGLLGALGGEFVLLDSQDEGSAVRITVVGDDDLLAILMPMRV
jgi:DNA polymerase III subunit beta